MQARAGMRVVPCVWQGNGWHARATNVGRAGCNPRPRGTCRATHASQCALHATTTVCTRGWGHLQLQFFDSGFQASKQPDRPGISQEVVRDTRMHARRSMAGLGCCVCACACAHVRAREGGACQERTYQPQSVCVSSSRLHQVKRKSATIGRRTRARARTLASAHMPAPSLCHQASCQGRRRTRQPCLPCFALPLSSSSPAPPPAARAAAPATPPLLLLPRLLGCESPADDEAPQWAPGQHPVAPAT